MATAASPLPCTARLLLPSTQSPHCLAHRLPAIRFNSVGRSLAAMVAAVTSPTSSPPSSSSGIVLVDRSEADKANRLKSAYLEKVVPLLKDEFGYKNIHEIPKIEKVVVNCGMGDAEQNSKGLEAAMKDLAIITGQRPVKTKAKNSIATFKLREGATVGIAVTLRGSSRYAESRGSVYCTQSYLALQEAIFKTRICNL